MARNDLQGSLDLLVLKTLSQRGKLHGYGIVLHIQRASDELLRVEEGSIYPALHRMEQSGWISSEWALTETNRKAKYYRLTAAGRKQLGEAEESFKQLVKGVRAMLRYAWGAMMGMLLRLLNLGRQRKIDTEIEAELESHIETRIEDNLAAGMTPDQC
jgi:PadR family transcriptional regulator, regulatory protein PadR